MTTVALRIGIFGAKKRDGNLTPIMGLYSRTTSVADLYRAQVRKDIVDSGNETSSQNSNDNWDEGSSEAGWSEYAQAAEVEPKPNKGLCKRCSMINIKSLSQEKGYVHSTLNVLKESARSCMLCAVFFDWFEVMRSGSTLDRYKFRLSLDIGNGSKEDYTNHSQSQLRRWKCIWVRVFDTRPWQPPKHGPGPGTGTGTESEPANLRQEEDEHGRRVLCYTEEGDPAADVGLPWLRKNVGYTGSSSSLSVANEAGTVSCCWKIRYKCRL